MQYCPACLKRTLPVAMLLELHIDGTSEGTTTRQQACTSCGVQSSLINISLVNLTAINLHRILSATKITDDAITQMLGDLRDGKTIPEIIDSYCSADRYGSEILDASPLPYAFTIRNDDARTD